MAKVAKKVQLKIVERESAFELVNAEVSEARAKVLVKQYQAAYANIAGIQIQYGKVAA
jgi:hypothetical protein